MRAAGLIAQTITAQTGARLFVNHGMHQVFEAKA